MENHKNFERVRNLDHRLKISLWGWDSDNDRAYINALHDALDAAWYYDQWRNGKYDLVYSCNDYALQVYKDGACGYARPFITTTPEFEYRIKLKKYLEIAQALLHKYPVRMIGVTPDTPIIKGDKLDF